MSSRLLNKKKNVSSSVLKLILVILMFIAVVLFAVIFGQKNNRDRTTTNIDSETIETTSTEQTSEETTIEQTTIESTTTTETDTTVTETTEETTETTEETTTLPATEQTTTTEEETTISPILEKIEVNLIRVNKYSRPGTKLNSVDYIIVHYVANPGTSAIANRNYFDSLATTHKTSASAHFVIGLDGEIIQCIPLDEVSYNAGVPAYNTTSISIECCHPDATGQFNDATYESLVELVSFLCNQYGLTTDNVIRHYDVTGKDCPKYWAGKEGTEQYARWKSFLDDVEKSMK